MSEKSTEELSFMTLESDAKFEEKLTCGLENNKNLVSFHQCTWKSQNWDFYEVLLSKVEMYELKIYRGVMCYDNEEWYNMWKGTDLSVQNWHEEFDEFCREYWEISKICTLMGCLWTKCLVLELRKYRGVMFDGTEYRCKI